MSHPIEQLEQIMATLRDPQKGCPWDRKQTFDTIVPHTLEETYEVVDAIHNQDWPNLKEELGDLLFQVIFYSQLAKEQGLFEFSDVVETVNEKLTRRHPHVFSQVEFESDEAINANWEAEKAKEKAQAGKTEQSILDSIPNSLPALLRATKMQKKCARYGFDWDSIGPVVEKVREELDEVLEESMLADCKQENIELELGDLMFAVVNLARHLEANPEVALAKANLKFARRFAAVEQKVSQAGRVLADCTLDELEQFWQQVKQDERSIMM
ncbi:nucleoside triphosphate pyrophosphohydrolase [Vibrio panuliri]|uniref:Nucleoside triphosphate pyrophosphohydrolase n=1 Tax=Vibrio panuliri TaxID=1381081 RepID=A0A1Q9HH14_9VIBR|nr:nucleoside triphosphate pyrophosphohydrolase [Vibrio panuliri]KAB1460083.1 nucleoside triphosphate pyrophosphohydrolase [Vibrio panuliri]OLQ89275.1 nucleoside triphosphate pyrophosphohydrolase [Vibrio panuliri]OLQ96485.1 nucleoside triphosphate pyrophosphohydrolase [Vibrio panuliri]